MKPLKVRVPHPKGGMIIGTVVRYAENDNPPAYIVDIGEYKSLRVPAHKVEAENHDEITKTFEAIMAEVQARLANKCSTAVIKDLKEII